MTSSEWAARKQGGQVLLRSHPTELSSYTSHPPINIMPPFNIQPRALRPFDALLRAGFATSKPGAVRMVLEATSVTRHRRSQYRNGPRAQGFPSERPGSDGRRLIKSKGPRRRPKNQSSRPSTQCPMHYEIKTPKQTTSSLQSTYPKTQMAYSTRSIRLRAYSQTPPLW